MLPFVVSVSGVVMTAQSQPTAPAPAFKAGVDLVALTVTVTDSRHQIVSQLSERDFRVVEDGVEQKVLFFARERVPLDLAILIDTSGSMGSTLPIAQQAAIGLAGTAEAGDRVMVVGIHDRADILAPLSDDLAATMDAIRRTRAQGNTALYTGLYVALNEMVKCRQDMPDVRRQAVAVLSDGRDTASLVSYDHLMDLLHESGIAVYTIALASSSDNVAWGPKPVFSTMPTALFVMRSFADETGGRAFVARRPSELPGIYSGIAAELAEQYVLGYISTNRRQDSTYRRVDVRLNQPALVARTRTGYQPVRVRP